MYTNVKVNISNKLSQKEKLKTALSSGRELSLRLSYDDLIGGNDIIALTQPQLSRLQKAYETGKELTIKLSKP